MQWQLREQAEYEAQRWKKEFNRRGDEIIDLENRLKNNTTMNQEVTSTATEDFKHDVDQWLNEIVAERRKNTELFSELESARVQLSVSNRKCDEAEAKWNHAISQLRGSEDEVANLIRQLKHTEIKFENEKRLMEVDCSAKADLIESLTSQVTSLNLRHADELAKVLVKQSSTFL
jgi:uncharacterized membrane-anchored protein YhcB (DUF1043 family)